MNDVVLEQVDPAIALSALFASVFATDGAMRLFVRRHGRELAVFMPGEGASLQAVASWFAESLKHRGPIERAVLVELYCQVPLGKRTKVLTTAAALGLDMSGLAPVSAARPPFRRAAFVQTVTISAIVGSLVVYTNSLDRFFVTALASLLLFLRSEESTALASHQFNEYQQWLIRRLSLRPLIDDE